MTLVESNEIKLSSTRKILIGRKNSNWTAYFSNKLSMRIFSLKLKTIWSWTGWIGLVLIEPIPFQMRQTDKYSLDSQRKPKWDTPWNPHLKHGDRADGQVSGTWTPSRTSTTACAPTTCTARPSTRSLSTVSTQRGCSPPATTAVSANSTSTRTSSRRCTRSKWPGTRGRPTTSRRTLRRYSSLSVRQFVELELPVEVFGFRKKSNPTSKLFHSHFQYVLECLIVLFIFIRENCFFFIFIYPVNYFRVFGTLKIIHLKRYKQTIEFFYLNYSR